MNKLIYAIAAAAVIAGAAVLIPNLAENVEAHGAQTSGKSDRLDLRTYGSDCSQHAWPYFEARCLRNVASPTRRAVVVRIVTTDRLSADVR